jgi:hypothetical protein
VTATWAPTTGGVLRLPSGRLVRGRGLNPPLPQDPQPPSRSTCWATGHRPPPVAWESRWLRWPDFRLPSDRAAARDALREAWARAEAERVEIACAGGHGRTGTALACLVVLDGLPNGEAVAYVREHYSPLAVETALSSATTPRPTPTREWSVSDTSAAPSSCTRRVAGHRTSVAGWILSLPRRRRPGQFAAGCSMSRSGAN